MKNNEWAGVGNWYTAQFWEFDPRTATRKNRDPVVDYSQSSYAAFNNNPLLFNDPKGQTGIATIDKESKTITISATMYFYGNRASSTLATTTAQDVQNYWNAANGKYKVDGFEYSVKFDIKGSVVNGDPYKEMGKNNSYENNYIRVGISTTGNGGVSFMQGNSGYYKYDELTDQGSGTAAHEMGHGFGEEHDLSNQKGQGIPNIMVAKGTNVDPEFQNYTGKVDPHCRTVQQGNINNLKIGEFINGKANVGNLTNNPQNPSSVDVNEYKSTHPTNTTTTPPQPNKIKTQY